MKELMHIYANYCHPLVEGCSLAMLIPSPFGSISMDSGAAAACNVCIAISGSSGGAGIAAVGGAEFVGVTAAAK